MKEPKGKPEIPTFKDKNVGLVAFGILQIFMGGFCLFLIPLMLFTVVVSNVIGQFTAIPLNLPMMSQSIVSYIVLMAVWSIWMGIGSIRARRWARALLLISSWLWLICGIISLIFWFMFVTPEIYKQIVLKEQTPDFAISIIKLVITIFLIGFSIVLPTIFILFYGSKNVKVTCEFRDYNVRWTDKCPLPVLGLSFMFVISAISMMRMAFYDFVVPFFGSLLSGTTGAVVLLISILLLGCLAVGTYKLKIAVWWSAVAMVLMGTVSTIMTFSRVSLLEFYQKMNLPEQQIKLIQQMGIMQNFSMNWYSVFWTVVFLGYLLYTKRYFTGKR